MQQKDKIALDLVDFAGRVLTTEYDYDLTYDPEEEDFIESGGDGYVLGVVEDSILFAKANDFVADSSSGGLKSAFGNVDIDNYFDFLEYIYKHKMGKKWEEFIRPFKREIGLEWANCSDLEPFINTNLEPGVIDPVIPEIPCRKCGALCNAVVDPDSAPSEIAGRRVNPVRAVCPSCGSRYMLRELNDGYEIGLHHMGDPHPFWTYERRDNLAREFSKNSTLDNELMLLFEEYHMRVHHDARLKKILASFKGRRKSPTNPDYVKVLCIANMAKVVKSPSETLRSLSGDGLTGIFGAVYRGVSEDARGYPSKPDKVVAELESALAGCGDWFYYYFIVNYLLSYLYEGAGDEENRGIVLGLLGRYMISLAERVADPACHDTCLKSLFCELIESDYFMKLPVSKDVLARCRELFCGDTDYRGITAVIGLQAALNDVRDGDFESGLKILKHLVEMVKNRIDAGPFTVFRACMAAMMVAVIEEDHESALVAGNLLTTLDMIISMDADEKRFLMLAFLSIMDFEADKIIPKSREEIIAMAKMFLGFSRVQFT